jgi:hypothetical protein
MFMHYQEKELKMLKMNVAIQCIDKRTLQKGTFGYMESKHIYSATPIFDSYVELKDYAEKHDIVLSTKD